MARQENIPLGGAFGDPARADAPRSGTTLTPADLEKRIRRVLLVVGIMALIGGAGAILVPAVATVTIELFIGWLLVFAGGIRLYYALSRQPRTRHDVLDGVLALAVGLSLVIFPLTGILTLTLLLAVWFFGSGGLLLYAAWKARGLPGNWLLGLDGTISVLIGALIVAHLPSSAAWAIGLLTGINLLFWGVRALVLRSLLDDPVA
jgi:uncharacterized membrane protein HdeD (DUF308 family)